MNPILNVYNIFVVCFADMVCYYFCYTKKYGSITNDSRARLFVIVFKILVAFYYILTLLCNISVEK